ncbi:PaaI family thioesterase [Mycobacterium sp. 134]|uniref:PaaI family thioesterase n=1 Tax=Mycobacterium sp. 134 TaxID=3400425 RepID=UPI003AAEE296
MTATPRRIAPNVQALHDRDAVAQQLGIQLVAAKDGYAALHLQVTPLMANGHGICHGGVIFLLADTAFAYAASADESSAGSVTASANVTFCEAARVGDILKVACHRRHAAGRTSFYLSEVTTDAGRTVALVDARMARRRD